MCADSASVRSRPCSAGHLRPRADGVVDRPEGRLSALAREAPALTTTDAHDETNPETETEEFEPLAARAPVREDSPLFADLGVDPQIVQALADVGITRTFAIQEMTLPIALAGSDLIGQARTGTGKTLGFGVPLLQGIAASAATSARRRRWSSSRPASCASRSPATCRRPASCAASGSPPSTAAARTSRRSRRCARASTSSSAPRAGCSTWPSRVT